MTKEPPTTQKGREPMREYLDAVSQRYADEGCWRMGQTFFNVLNEMYPELAEDIRGTALDPFHNDVIIPAFVAWVSGRLQR